MGILDSIKTSLGMSGFRKSSKGHVLGGPVAPSEESPPIPQYNSGDKTFMLLLSLFYQKSVLTVFLVFKIK